MLFAIDIGNTTITLGLFRGKGLAHSWRMSALAEKTSDEYGVVLKELLASARIPPRDLRRAIISSVVPRSTKLMIETLRRLAPTTKTVLLGRDVEVPMVNRYRDPHQVGQDRLANAYAVLQRYGAPGIVVDFGTAMTFDVVSPKGEYLGGVIVPGIEISMEALSSRAAMLPHIELIPPEGILGRDTVSSMRSGAFYGFGYLCDGMLVNLKQALGSQGCFVVLTGGQSEMISPFVKTPHHVDPFLTLYGLFDIDAYFSKKCCPRATKTKRHMR